MKKNRPLLFVGILAIANVIIGVLSESWIFFAGAIFSISFLVVSTKDLASTDFDIEVSRSSEGKEVYVGDKTNIKIHVKNKGDKVKYLEVFDELPSQVKVSEGSNHQIIELEENEEKEIEYELSCPITGKIELGPIHLRYMEPLHFFSKKWEAEEYMNFRVLPEIEEMDSIDINPNYTKHWLGEIKSRSIGMGSDFYSIRKYNRGDQFRNINWKATAKQSTPMTNEFEGEKAGDVILVVDGYEESVIGDLEHNTLKSSIRAAGTLASQLLSERNRVGLIILGDYLRWLYPSTGKMQFHKIMENLSRFEKGGIWELREIKWLIKDFFPRKSQIIFISPLIVSKFSETIVDLCLKDYQVTVISPDPMKIERETAENYDERAEKLWKGERKAMIEKLWNYGMVVDWDPTKPLEAELEEVVKYQTRARHRG